MAESERIPGLDETHGTSTMLGTSTMHDGRAPGTNGLTDEAIAGLPGSRDG